MESKTLKMDYWNIHEQYLLLKDQLRKKERDFEIREAQLIKENSELRRRLTMTDVKSVG